MFKLIPQTKRALLASIALIAVSFASAARAQKVDPGDVALAERMSDTARMTLGARVIMPQHWKMAAALLEGASRVNPTESRFPRFWADAALNAHDVDGALKATKAYLALEPDDKVAMAQLTDLYASSYQTVDKRLDYLRGWIEDTRLPEEVRSHIAFLAFQAYAERSQDADAKIMLDRALALNPISVEVLKARWARIADTGTAYERVATLLALLKANPDQVAAVTQLAQTLADMGMAQQSLPFFSVSVSLAQREGYPVPPEYGVAYAVELMLANQPQPAKQIIDSLTKARPSDFDGLAVRLLLERIAAQKDDAAKTQQQLLNVLLNRLSILRKDMGDQTATTRPVEATGKIEWGSLAADIQRLKDMKDESEAEVSKQALIGTLTDIAWCEIYFANDAAEAKPVIDALKQLLPEDSPVIARLEGWSFLARGETDQARVKLTAVRNKDPLAELGAIKLLDATEGKKQGDRFLVANPTGLIAMLALDALADRKVALTPAPEKSGPIAEALGKFPMEWLGILEQPQNFYVLRGEPLKVPHAYGEPIFAKITIQNISQYPITIGSEGIIRPDLWIDAQVRGIAQAGAPQMLSGTAFDRMGHEMILKPRGFVSQVVRVDQGALAQMLTASPFPSMQVVMAVRTNPSTTSPQGISPAGQFVQMTKFVERTAFPLTSDSMNTLGRSVTQGGGAEKIRSIELAGNVAVILSQQQGNAGALQWAQQLVEVLKGATHDSSTPVQVWAGTTIARLSAPNDRPAAVGRLVNDPNWVARLMGLASMGGMNSADQKQIATRMGKSDADLTVAAYAKAAEDLLANMPATAPATLPTTGPTNGPAPTTSPTTPPAIGMNPPGPLSTRPTGFDRTSPPTTKPASDVVVPALPLTLPPSTAPAVKP